MKAIELSSAGVIAVSVDDAGQVSGRADVQGHDLVAAALEALGQLPSADMQPAAVAFAGGDATAAEALVETLAQRGAVLPHPPIPSGTAAVIAESWAGAARGARHVVFFGVGEHATAGILRNGSPITGVHRAPAVAWLALNPVERDDYRRSGCLEAEVAGAGIVRRLIWRVKAGDDSRVQAAVAGDLAAITLAHVLAAARERDGVATSVMRDTAKYMGMAAANLAVIAEPEVLVLGGIIASAADLLLDAVRTEVSRRLPPEMAQAISIVPAQLGLDAPAIGAARISGVGPGTAGSAGVP